jgi:putative FmdB family regulatory protein
MVIMPIYEYTCEACRCDVEVIQKITEQPLVKCPRCGEDRLKKKTSMVSFHLKGGGWFKDGYGNGNNGEKGQTVSTPTEAGGTAAKNDTVSDASTGPAKESTPKESPPAAKDTPASAAAS